MAGGRPAAAGPRGHARAGLALVVTLAGCTGAPPEQARERGQEPPAVADSVRVTREDGSVVWVIPDTLPPLREIVPGVDGPWAYAAWLTWSDTAAAAELVDTALSAMTDRVHAWDAMHTWRFVVEALEKRVEAGDTAALAAALGLSTGAAKSDSLVLALAEWYSRMFEADPHLFAAAAVGLALSAQDRVVGLLLDGWLHRAIRGTVPREPPSARLAAGRSSLATRRLQAKLAMREPEYLRALRDALERRQGTVT